MGTTTKDSSSEVTCELCGGDKTDLVYPSWGVVRCSSCGLIFSPDRSVPADLYEEGYTREGKIATYEFDGQAYKFRAEKLWRKLFESLTRYQRPGRLLDVGCGLGFLLGLAKSLGWDPYGLDVSSYAAEYAREHFGVPVHTGVLEHDTYPPEFFDTVICSHVLKHVPSPRGLLREIHTVLRPGGVLVILVPTPFSSLSYKLSGKLHGPGPPTHLFFFSVRTLTMLLRQQGFEVLKKVVNTHLIYVIDGFSRSKGLKRGMERVSEEVVTLDTSNFRQRVQGACVRAVKAGVNAVGSLTGVSDEATLFARKHPV